MAQMVGTLKQRSDKVAFLGIPDTEATGGIKFLRMQGFTTMSTNKNPKEYSRQYVDEVDEQTDIVGFSNSIDFGFDYYVGNEVHDFIAEIIDNEIIGTAAVIQLLVVDITVDTLENNNGKMRPYAVIPSTEGDSFDAYTYSGSFASKGTTTWGKAVLDIDGLTAEFTVA